MKKSCILFLIWWWCWKILILLLDKKNISKNDHYLYFLEEPVEKKYLKNIDKKKLLTLRTSLKDLIESFDIIQIEFWNHPKLIEFLVNVALLD